MAARLTAYVVVGIVAATLIAGLIVGAQRDDSDGPVDLIVHNATVYTADDDRTMAEALAIRGNQILRVGSEREVLRLRRPQTILIDAGGASVLPGFVDAHQHFVEGGLSLDQVDLRDAVTIAEMQQRIRAWADGHPERPWIQGRGWIYEPFAGGLPTRHVLDAVIPDRPVHLVSYDGHVSWANSRALGLAGITRGTPDPESGTIVRDPRTAEPTGVLKEAAMALVGRHVPQPTHEERSRALRAAVSEAHRHGVTSVQNAAGDTEDLELYADARRSGDLRVRVYSAVTIDRPVTDSDLDRLEATRGLYPDDPIFKTGAVRIGLDGVVETHTAAMLQPYANAPTSGRTTMTPDDLNRTARLLDARGWQILTDASGDRAVRMALNAYAHAVRSNRVRPDGRRHRIEQVGIVDPDDVPRFAGLGVIASLQPIRPTDEDLWVQNLGPVRARRAWAYDAIGLAEGTLALGSDWPLGPINPLLGLYSAITRAASPDSLEEEPSPDRAALQTAIDAYTSAAAWASFDEKRKGTLAPGMLADVVVLSDDIFSIPASELPSARVAITIFDGKVVFRRDRKQMTN